MTLGITGGLGCGKSTAAGLLEARGFTRIDSDRVVREQILTRPEIIAQIHGRHGPDIVDAAGAVDRVKLGEKVFASDAERIWLEELTHPEVFIIWRRAFAAEPAAKWAVEVPLLFEKGLENWFDFTVCVACAPTLQLARLEQRGLSRALARQRISKQLPLARKIEHSDFVLWNDGSPAFLEAQVDRLIPAVLASR